MRTPTVSLQKLRRTRPETAAIVALALLLAVGWAFRERTFAREKEAQVASQTVTLDQVAMKDFSDQDRKVGRIGLYVSGDTPASSKFVTGRFVLDPGKTPHAPHTHVEEEVMVVESGHGEIFCDGKTTKVGPGSVMFTTPNAPHGITNTGESPLVFYFIKWAGREAK
jgi:mannose-6-phosphate isomerase-like protein (cupin superfamily)